MSVGERDPFTGHMTTGHNWNGITELNTSVPKVVYFFLIVTTLFAIAYQVLMPAWPLGDTYTRGLLGANVRTELADELVATRQERAWMDEIESLEIDQVRQDGNLMQFVAQTGPTLFGDNCQACHGSGGVGRTGAGFPNLADRSWLWGDDPATIEETLRVGINSTHPESRVAQMLAFGEDKILDGESIGNVVNYLLSLSNPSIGDGSVARELLSTQHGKQTYDTTCIACHGADGTGNPMLGAPNLVDDFWLYGGDKDSLLKTLRAGRAGHMPAWEDRLSPAQRRILALYVTTLGDADPKAGTR